MRDAPAVVGNKQGGVKQMPHEVVYPLVLGEGSVATLVSEDPHPHEHAALEIPAVTKTCWNHSRFPFGFAAADLAQLVTIFTDSPVSKPSYRLHETRQHFNVRRQCSKDCNKYQVSYEITNGMGQAWLKQVNSIALALDIVADVSQRERRGIDTLWTWLPRLALLGSIYFNRVNF